MLEFGGAEDAELESFFLREAIVPLWFSGVVFRGFLGRGARLLGPKPAGATAAEGVGGAELSLLVGAASGAGGLGRGGGAGIEIPFGRCGASDAEESNLGRVDCRCTVPRGCTATAPALGCARIVGEEVGCRWYFGRC